MEKVIISVSGYNQGICFFIMLPELYSTTYPVGKMASFLPGEGGFIGQSFKTTEFVLLEERKLKSRHTMYTGAQIERTSRNFRAALSSGDAAALKNVLFMLEHNELRDEEFRMKYGIFIKTVWNGKKWEYVTSYSHNELEKYDGGIYHMPNSDKQGYELSKSQIASKREAVGEQIKICTSKQDLLEVKDVFKVNAFGVIKSNVIPEIPEFEMRGYYEEDPGSTEHGNWSKILRDEMKVNDTLRRWIIVIAALIIKIGAGKKIYLVCQHNKKRDDAGCGRRDCHLSLLKNTLINIVANTSGKNPYHEDAVAMSNIVEL